MHRRFLTTSIVACLGVVLPASASASKSAACGGIDLDAMGECHFELSASCQGACDATSFQLRCDGQCNASASAECTGQCQGQCLADCQVDPGQFECSASCRSECVARADAQCGCEGQSQAQVEASCSAQCDAQCQLVAPSASCESQCSACCSASCDVEANVNCSLDCAAELEGSCNVDCQGNGALFCDGQYVEITNYAACAVDVAAHWSGQASAQGSFNFACNVVEPGLTHGRWAELGVGLAVGLTALRRRSRKGKVSPA